jgi:hypothetical protein
MCGDAVQGALLESGSGGVDSLLQIEGDEMILQHCSRESCVQIIEGLQEQVAALTKALQEIVDCPTWAIGSLDMQRYREMTK